MTVTFSLEKVHRLAKVLGAPHLAIPPYVFILGISGKTCVALFLTRLLRKHAGLKVGTFIHPPPHNNTSSSSAILIDEQSLRPSHFQELWEHVRRLDQIYDLGCTHYEWLFLVACLAFRECRCEVAVIEAAMGGPFEATNLLPREPDRRLTSILTTVTVDHMRFLGFTLTDITTSLLSSISENSSLCLSHHLPPMRDGSLPLSHLLHGPWDDVMTMDMAIRKARQFVLVTPPEQQASNLNLALHAYEIIWPLLSNIFHRKSILMISTGPKSKTTTPITLTSNISIPQTIFADLIIPHCARQFYFGGHRVVVDAAQNEASPLLPWLAQQPIGGINLCVSPSHKDHEVLKGLIRKSGVHAGRKYSWVPFRALPGYPWIQPLEAGIFESEILKHFYPGGDYQFAVYSNLMEALTGINEELVIIFGSPWIVRDFLDNFVYEAKTS